MNIKESKAGLNEINSSFSNKNENGDFFSMSSQTEKGFFGPNTIQPKLEVGAPDDEYEKEADRVADKVMRMPEPKVQRKCKQCEKEELQKKSISHIRPNGKKYVGSEISNHLTSSSGQGSRLQKDIKIEMEHKIGADFSGVNIHTGSDAHYLNRQLGARAFTHGRDIYFNKGEYNPTFHRGKHLLAHELTHVVQQTKKNFINNYIQRDGPTIGPLSPDQRSQVDQMSRTFEIQVVDATMIGPLLKVDFRIRGKGHVRWINAHFFGAGPGIGITLPLMNNPGPILERTVPHPIYNETDLFGRAQACAFSIPRTNVSGLVIRLTSGPASIGYADIVWTIPGISVGGAGCYFGRFEGGHGV